MAALQKKTVILVTHQVEFLSQVHKILVMRLTWCIYMWAFNLFWQNTFFFSFLGHTRWRSYSVRKLRGTLDDRDSI